MIQKNSITQFSSFFLLLALAVGGALFNSGCSAERAKAAHLARGESYLAERRFQEAALEFRSAIEADKNFAPAHYGLARAYEGQLRFAETVEELRRTADLDAHHLDARVKLGNYLLLTRPPQIGDVERIVKEIFAVDANFVEGHVLQASLLAVQNKPEAEVLAVLERAISLDPGRVETYLSMARFFMSRENTAEAEKTFKRALQVNESSAVAQMEYARFLEFTDRAAEAEKYYLRATELEPRNREPLESLAMFYLGQRQLDKAEGVYKKLVALAPDRPEDRVVLAEFYATSGKEDEAIKVYQEILSQKPEYVRGRAKLGELFLQRDDLAGVNNQIAEILSRNSKDTQGLMLRSRVHLRKGAPDAAIKDLQEVLKQEPSSRLALYYMADAQLKNGQIEQARNFVADLQRYHPDYLYAKLLDAQINFAAGDLENALKITTELIAKTENGKPTRENSAANLAEIRFGALSTRGLANLQLNKRDEARADLQAAQRLAPNSPNVYQNLATLALKNRNFDEATGFYEKALSLDTNNFEAFNGWIAVKTAQKDFNAAYDRINRAIEANSGRADLQAAYFYLKSNVLIAERRFAEAEAALARSLELNKDYTPAYTAYAALLAEQNKTDEAIEKYKAVLQRNPRDAGTFVLIGMLEDGRGNFDAAAENYRKALEVNPNMPIAANNLAWIYAAHGKGSLDEAVSLAQNLIEKYPNEAGYADTLGWAFYKKGVHELALAQAKRAVALDEKAATESNRSANPSYRARLGAILAAAGDKQNAQRELELALKNSASLSQGELQEARAALESLRGNS